MEAIISANRIAHAFHLPFLTMTKDAIAENRIVGIEETHTEYAAVDRLGRMQIPADIMKEIGLLGKGNVSLNVEGEKLVITVPEEGQKKKKGS